MPTDLRIYQHHSLTFDRGEKVTINYDGKPVTAFTKEPVAVALFAAGHFTTGRSLKFHRPRGVFCLSGHCQSCLMEVDGVPNIRTCRTFPSEGMVVRSQGGFPKVTNDLLFLNDFIFRKGLNYHTLLTRPRSVNRMLKGVVQKLAASASLPESAPAKIPVLKNLSCDVAVIGAGPAGVAAAMGAAKGGGRVILLDEEPLPGGRLRMETEVVEIPGGDGPARGMEYAANYPDLLKKSGVEFLGNTLAAGFYNEGVLLAVNEEASWAIQPKRLIVCTGTMDQISPFPGNDLPKILSARALRRLTNLHGICPAVQAFVIGTDDEALSIAMRLPEIGIKVVGVLEMGDKITGSRSMADIIQRSGVPFFVGYKVQKALGRFHLKGVKLVPASAKGDAIVLRCDLIAASARRAPAYQLLDQAGVDLTLDLNRGGFVSDTDDHFRTQKQNVFAAGEVTGATDLPEIVRQGRIAGLSAALDFNASDELEQERSALLE